MSLGTRFGPPSRFDGLPTALAVAVVAVLLVPVWYQIIGSLLFELVDPFDLYPNSTVPRVAIYLALLGGFVAAFVRVQSVDVPAQLPDRDTLPVLAVAVLVPTALVFTTDLVSGLASIAYWDLAETPFPLFVLPESSIVSISASQWLFVAAAWAAVCIVTPLLVVHVVVQGSLRSRVDRTTSVVATTAIGGVLFASQRLSFAALGPSFSYPTHGDYLGILLLVAAIAIAVVGYDRAAEVWQRSLAVLPLVVIVVLTAAQFLGFVDSLALVGDPLDWSAVVTVPRLSLAASQVAIVGVAAYAYEETRSILAPALAYVATYLASGVVIVYEALQLF